MLSSFSPIELSDNMDDIECVDMEYNPLLHLYSLEVSVGVDDTLGNSDGNLVPEFWVFLGFGSSS